MRKKNIYKIIAFALCIALLTGCGSQKVEYGENETATEEQDTGNADLNPGLEQESGEAGTEPAITESPLAKELGAEDRWETEWSIPRDSGGAWTIKVNAKVEVPNTDSMQVVRVAKKEFDAAEKKKIAERLFDNDEIYMVGNGGYATKEELQREIDAVTEVIQNSEADGTAWEGDFQQLAELQENLNNFKEPQKGDYSGFKYKGTVNGQPYLLMFGNGEHNCNDIEFFPDENATFYGKTAGSGEIQFGGQDSLADFGENQAVMTMEQAKEEALRACDAMGISGMEIAECHDLNWGSPIEKDDGTVDYKPVEKNGYAIALERNLNGCLVSCQEPSGAILTGANPEGIKGTEVIQVCITDDGVIDFKYRNPLSVEETMAEHTELLSFENVKKVIEQYAENYNNYVENLCYDHMELTYFLVEDETAEGKDACYLLPVWRLYYYNYIYDVYGGCFDSDTMIEGAVINAIDGTLYTGFGKV